MKRTGAAKPLVEAEGWLGTELGYPSIVPLDTPRSSWRPPVSIAIPAVGRFCFGIVVVCGAVVRPLDALCFVVSRDQRNGYRCGGSKSVSSTQA